jgi:hypothetical protein
MIRSMARSKGTWVAMLAALGLGLALIVLLTSPGSHPKPAQAQTTTTPRAASLIIDNFEASFSKVDELTSTLTIPQDYNQSSPTLEPIRIVLERPLTGGMEMASWHQVAVEGNMAAARKNATLVLYNGRGAPTAKFNLQNACPAEYHIEQQGTQFVERVRLTAESLQRVSPS